MKAGEMRGGERGLANADLEADARDAVHLGLRVDHRVVPCALALVRLSKAAGVPKVDAASELADHHDVHPLHVLPLLAHERSSKGGR